MEKEKKLYEQIKKLLNDKLDEQGVTELLHNRKFEEKMQKQWHMEKEEEKLSNELRQTIWAVVKRQCFGNAHSRRKVLYQSAVAAVILVLVLGATWMYFSNDRKQNTDDGFVEITSVDGCMHILPDSSQVWMYPGSSILYTKNFVHGKKVWLKGKSHFDIRKQDKTHFLVYIDDGIIEVKGTSFLVNQEQGKNSEITLFNGSIDFTIESSGHTIEMEPSQKLILNPQDMTVKIKNIKGIKWKEGYYEFTNIDLYSWIAFVEQIYNAKITIEQKPMANHLLNGRLRYNEPLEEAIKKLCFSIGWQYKKEKREYIICR